MFLQDGKFQQHQDETQPSKPIHTLTCRLQTYNSFDLLQHKTAKISSNITHLKHK